MRSSMKLAPIYPKKRRKLSDKTVAVTILKLTHDSRNIPLKIRSARRALQPTTNPMIADGKIDFETRNLRIVASVKRTGVTRTGYCTRNTSGTGRDQFRNKALRPLAFHT